jgi:protein ImuB
MPVRTLVVWCPDWPVQASGVAYEAPVAVVHANRLVACSPAARAEGIWPGLRRREAQGRCPGLVFAPHDPARDARAFEPVAVAVETLAPRVEIVRPGECAFPARGAARYHGGEHALAALVATTVTEVLGAAARCRVGIADGVFAAGLAARRGAIVLAGGAPAFLAPFGVDVLDRPGLADLLRRLGLDTLGQLAALSRVDLAARFGPEGARAHRLASGQDERPQRARRPPPDLRVAAELDPPADRVDVAAFAAKALADELSDRLRQLGLACLRLRIEAETEYGERLVRVWRHQDGFASAARQSASSVAAAMAERVRWQLDGWLAGGPAVRPTGGISRLVLVPDEVVADRGRQLGFWGEEAEQRERATRALARIQGLLGADSVRTATLRGGRGPTDRVAFDTPLGADPAARPATGPASPPGGPGPASPLGGTGPAVGSGRAAWGSAAVSPNRPASAGRVPPGRAASRGQTSRDQSPPDRPGPTGRQGPTGRPGEEAGVSAPWPGRVPAPAPATVHPEPLTAELLDASGAVVAVSGRGVISAPPARLWVGGGSSWTSITAWAGPWPVDERWWDPAAHQRLARLQVVTAEGVAYLLKLTGGAWWVEATYD